LFKEVVYLLQHINSQYSCHPLPLSPCAASTEMTKFVGNTSEVIHILQHWAKVALHLNQIFPVTQMGS